MKCVALGLAMILLLLTACSGSHDDIDLSMYEYRDTRNLVRYVHSAAQQVQAGGLEALEDYRPNSKSKSDYYLYVYTTQGVNLFHAGMPELQNKDLHEITDKDGKHVFQLVVEAVRNPQNPHGWIHYTWWEPGKFYPVPKSSCHFMVTMPDGREVYVGGGINYPLEEDEFARIAVDSAVDLIERNGEAAIPVIAEPTSSYNFREVSVFAFRPDGYIVISPVLGDSLFHTDLLSCVDEVGHKPFEHAVQQLEQQSAVWQIFMAKNRYERQLVKKSLYLRKTTLCDMPLYVGAVTDMPQTP